MPHSNANLVYLPFLPCTRHPQAHDTWGHDEGRWSGETSKTALGTASTKDMLQLSLPRNIDLERIPVLLVRGFSAHYCPLPSRFESVRAFEAI